MKLFRFEVRGLGIYEAVEYDCPRNDKQRNNKPDGSWLPRVGGKYPNAISYWTEEGLHKYQESGLKDWHLSVTKGLKVLKVSTLQGEPLYEDAYQVIGYPDRFVVINERTL